MPRSLSLAIVQSAFSDAIDQNIANMADRIREAASQGADVVLLPELFQGPYFCKTQDEEHFSRAFAWRDHPAVMQLAPLAAELNLVLPLSIFEKDGPHFYNTLVMVDADGSLLGIYRKSHIPDGPGYQEKFYFRPGNTGFKVWNTLKGRIGVGICWDQWFPEAARIMTLQGAEILLYPTAIGSEPHDAALDTSTMWRRAMQGHAVSNIIPVAAANRVGDESGQTFYGTSFICNHQGDVRAQLDRTEQGVRCVLLDLEQVEKARAAWGFFRDRRPDLYDPIASDFEVKNK